MFCSFIVVLFVVAYCESRYGLVYMLSALSSKLDI